MMKGPSVGDPVFQLIMISFFGYPYSKYRMQVYKIFVNTKIII